jgi:zinc ribbon protein
VLGKGVQRLPGLVSGFIESVSSPAALKRDWMGPLVGAAVAFIGSFVLFTVVIAVFNGTLPPGERLGGISNIVKGGGLAVFLVQRVALTLSAPVPLFGTAGGKVVFAPLGGLLLVGLLLALGGSLAAGRQEGTARQRVLAGTRLAVPYALICFIASFVFRITSNFASEGQLTLAPSHVGALFLPLVWGLAFGSLGAARRVHGKGWWMPGRERLEARFGGASAALRGLRAGVVTAVVLLLAGGAAVLAVAIVRHPHTAGTIVTDPRSDATIVLGFLLLWPNAAVMAFQASMGGSLRQSASAFGSAHPSSISIFGAGGSSAAHVPAYWLLALLLPAVAMLRAGFVAARASSGGRQAALRAAAGAGIALTVLVWILERVSGGYVSALGSFGVSFGPSPATAFLLPPVWAIGGTWLGALLYLQRHPPIEAPVASGTASAPPPAAPASDSPAAPQPVAVFCTNCGASNSSTDRTCQACGHPLDPG